MLSKLLTRFLKWFYTISIMAKKEAQKEVYRIQAMRARKRYGAKVAKRILAADKKD